jgi:hypothetical protein
MQARDRLSAHGLEAERHGAELENRSGGTLGTAHCEVQTSFNYLSQGARGLT